MSGELTQARAVAAFRPRDNRAHPYYRRRKAHLPLRGISVGLRMTGAEVAYMDEWSGKLHLTRSGLCRKLIERIFSDDLVKAVLDEEEA